VPVVFRIPTTSDPTPRAVAASWWSVNKLEEPAFRKAITPEPMITGRSMYVLRRVKTLSDRLCMIARPFAFSPVEAK